MAEFTASNAHFLTKPGLLICSVAIGGKENGLGCSVNNQDMPWNRRGEGEER